MDFSSDKEANIAARDIFSSEDGGAKTQMMSDFDELVNELG